MKRFFAAGLAAILLSNCVAGDDAGSLADLDIPAIEPGEISADTLRDMTRELSLDRYEGRMPGTPGEELTLAYLVEKFAAAGLEPGNNGSWFQDVPLVEITGKNYAPLSVTADGERTDFGFGREWVGVTYREQGHIDLDDSELVFVGYGINAPERGWNDYEGIDMAGKTAVILVNDPDWTIEGLEGTFNGRAMTYYGRWTYKFEEAARQGAAAALIVHEEAPASYPWGVVENGWTGPQAYAVRSDGGADQTLMNGWVQKDVAERLLEMAGQDLGELTQAATSQGFRPVPLGIGASTSFDNDIRRYESKNVVGLLRGSERPDEYVVHSAHWDHLGRCNATPEGDDICNGAIDNATGTAALVALAEAYNKSGPPARSLLFLAVTAEEQGLLGSEFFAANPVVPLDRIVGGLNMDSLHPKSPTRDVGVVGGGKSQLDAFLEAALAWQGRTQTPDSTPEAGYYYRSDHFSFAKRGVPMLYVDPGEDLSEGGREAGRAWDVDYRANIYHSPNDEFDPAWDWTNVVQDVELYYVIGRMLAQSTSWPNWLPDDEFRLLRDELCAGDGGC
ncbi:MAG TPA: M28 family metallopeptidase [Sphingomonadaceae bacterium]|nr:M28 family metallopeptidase [Sphingomonadaceae bacterium]